MPMLGRVCQVSGDAPSRKTYPKRAFGWPKARGGPHKPWHTQGGPAPPSGAPILQATTYTEGERATYLVSRYAVGEMSGVKAFKGATEVPPGDPSPAEALCPPRSNKTCVPFRG